MLKFKKWGYKANPLEPKEIQPTKDSVALFHGRNVESKTIEKQLRGGERHLVIEGMIGVGKTSLINFSTYREFTTGITGGFDKIIIPPLKSIDFTENEVDDDVLQKIYTSVLFSAIYLKQSKEVNENSKIKGRAKNITDWLDKKETNAWGIGLNILGSGIDFSASFSKLRRWPELEANVLELTHLIESNGFVATCLIDNLEFIEKKANIKKLFANQRQRIFSNKGIRFILAGARGLTGVLQSLAHIKHLFYEPLKIERFEVKELQSVINHRFKALENPKHSGSHFNPLPDNSVGIISEYVLPNTRNIIDELDRFCDENDISDKSNPKDKEQIFREWLDKKTKTLIEAAESNLRQKKNLRKILKKALEYPEGFMNSNHSEFGIQQQPNFSSACAELVEFAYLDVAAMDHNDKRKRYYTLTPDGWWVARKLPGVAT